jgi:hypothetical protein
LGDFFELRADGEAQQVMNPIDEDQERALPLTAIQRLWSIARPTIPDVNPSRLLGGLNPLEIGSNFGSHFECQ